MPLSRVESYDHFWRRAGWKLKFCFLPRKSTLSNRLIWFTYAYQGMATYMGPGEPAFEFRWLTKEEFIFEKLKGTI